MTADILALPRADEAPLFTDAVLIDHHNMWPEVPRGSIAFLSGRSGFVCDGIYSFPNMEADLRRVQVHYSGGGGYLLMMDNWPGKGREIITADALREHAPRRVVGTAHPFTAEFAEFLRVRFVGAIQ